ncbi:MAG: SDR family NAD(P)-dependent oxidoreductase [Deltaproteobacteria bacterium]|nr:SDR family NAD(P)-dependent oxidoreductase [Deltaproteobacteria bacterium]
MNLLKGKTVAITGAGGGIGRAHALLAAKEGAQVVVNDLGGSRDGTGSGTTMAEKVCEEIRAMGGKAAANYGNVATAEGANSIVETAVKEFGKLDAMICNAGILRDKSFKNMNDELWDPVMAVHLKGTYYCAKAAWMHFLDKQIKGRLVFTSSTSGLFGNFGQTNYGAAKAGIWGLMNCLWREGEKAGITVNAICPVALTRLTEDLAGFKGDSAPMAELKPEHISPTVIWLCSDQAAGVSGRTFLVKGAEVELLTLIREPGAKTSSKDPWDPSELGPRLADAVRKSQFKASWSS